MTPSAAAALRDEASRLRAQADRLDAIADQAAAAPEGARAEATNWIPTGRAQQIMRANSPSSVYRLIDKHPEIARRVNRRWQIDEEKFRAALERDRGESGEASGESGECNGDESGR